MTVIKACLAILPILVFGFAASAFGGPCDIAPESQECLSPSPPPPQRYVPKQICLQKESDANGGNCIAKPGSASGSAVPDPVLSSICPDYSMLIEKCVNETESAKESTCNYKKNKDTTNFMATADGMVKMLGMTTGMNIQMACTKMKDISQLANGAMLAFKTSCLIDQNSCASSCEIAVNAGKADPRLASCDPSGEWKTMLNSSTRACKGLTTTIDDAGAHMMAMYATQLNAQKCDEMTTANLEAYCQSNPNDPMCGTTVADCSNPTTAASNTICICQANPRDSRCGTTTASTSGTNGSSNGANGSSSADGSAAGLNGLSGAGLNLTGLEGDAGFDPAAGGARGASAGNQTGGKGTGRNIGGGDGPAGGGKPQAGAGGAAGSGASTKVLGGYYGGGGGAFMGGGSGSSGSGGGGYQAGGGNPGGSPQVDLKQFLPGGKQDPSRNLAGISGPDGITGPNSDIWRKVNTRYRSLGSTLKP